MNTTSERGVALITAMLLVFILASIGTVAVKDSRRMARDARLESRSLIALNAAEGGLALARARLAKSPEWTGDRVVIGACAVLVRVHLLGKEDWRIESTATHGFEGSRILPVIQRLTIRRRHGRDRYVNTRAR